METRNFDQASRHPYFATPNPIDGNLVVDPEVELKVKGGTVSVKLLYNARSTVNAEYGQSRSSSVNDQLAYLRGSNAIITRGDGRADAFVKGAVSGTKTTFDASSTAYSPTTLIYDSATSRFYEGYPDGREMAYYKPTVSGNYRPEVLSTPTGLRTTYAYDVIGTRSYLRSIQEPSGQRVTFNYSTGTPTSLLSSIVDWSGRTWTLAYDASRYLTSFQTPLGCTTQYTYDNAGSSSKKLHAIDDPRGYRTIYMYDTSDRVVSMGAGTAVWTWSYSLGGGLYGSAVTAPSGAITTYVLDADGNIANEQRPEGYTVTYSYEDRKSTRLNSSH